MFDLIQNKLLLSICVDTFLIFLQMSTFFRCSNSYIVKRPTQHISILKFKHRNYLKKKSYDIEANDYHRLLSVTGIDENIRRTAVLVECML